MNKSPRSVISRLWCTGAVVVGLAGFASPCAAAPIFRFTYGLTNREPTIGGLNNAGDFVGSLYSTNQVDTLAPTAFLMRNGTIYDLFPTNANPAALSVYANAISQRKADGSVQVVGTVHQNDGFERAITWTVAADLSFSFQVLSNRVLGPDSLAPGEQRYGEALGVNSAGTIVGDGTSYLAGMGLRWDPPYGLPTPEFYSTASYVAAVDDQGVMCINGVEFDHGGANNRFTAAIVNPSVVEVPELDFPNEVIADAMYAGRVVGRARIADRTDHAFVWTIGAPASVQLPDPAGITVTASEATSVNAAGDVVGYAQFVNTNQFGNILSAGTAFVLWKNVNGAYQALTLNSLFPLETGFYPSTVRQSYTLLINDAGQLVLPYPWARDPQTGQVTPALRVAEPVHDGIVQFATTGFSGQETDGFINATVTLFRADENTQAVTVQYQTSDGDASAGTNYVAQNGTVTWGPTESGDKTIRIPVIHTPAYEAYQSFNLALSNPTNAFLGNWTNVTLTIYDAYETLQFANLDPMQGAYFVVKGQTNVVLELERQGGTDGTLALTNLFTLDGTAVAGVDYVGLTNVSLTWPPGDAAPKLITVQLRTGSAIFSVKSFYLSGSGYLDNTNNPMSTFVGINLVPTNQIPQPSFDASVLSVQKGSLSLRSALAQGATLVIENSTNLAAWTTAAELRSSNGIVQFLAPFQTGTRVQFFRAHVK